MKLHIEYSLAIKKYLVQVKSVQSVDLRVTTKGNAVLQFASSSSFRTQRERERAILGRFGFRSMVN